MFKDADRLKAKSYFDVFFKRGFMGKIVISEELVELSAVDSEGNLQDLLIIRQVGESHKDQVKIK